MPKKVAILNMHFSNNNYGAVLQAAALQEFLRKEGYDPVNIKLIPVDTRSPLRIILSKLKFKINQWLYPLQFYTVKNKIIFNEFRNQWVSETNEHYSVNNISSFEERNDVENYIVGSDQVWRPSYTVENAQNYFFDFVRTKGVKKIAYAASFGMDVWDSLDNKFLTESVKDLLSGFDAVSVREDSGVDICRDVFQCKSTHVIDPTLLVGKEFFEKIITESLVPAQPKNIVYYKLDPDHDFMRCLDMLSNELNTSCENIYFKEEKHGKTIRRKYNSIPVWLAKLQGASLVVTDSYHCVCFALLFNKPFIHFNNASRGNARLDSLFRMLSLDSDYLTIESSEDIVSKKYRYLTDFSEINDRLEKLRKISSDFLRDSLKGSE